MSLVMGIVGLPNVGKSSLFNALIKGEAIVENRPFSTIEPNLGVVNIPDIRLEKLSELVKPKKTTYSVVKFLDIAGLIKGASKGEGLGNKFLENIRTVDAICLVVRAFDDKNILSVNSYVDPVFEMEIVLCELIYSDLEMVENILKKLKSNDCKVALLNKIKCHFQNNKLLTEFYLTEDEKEMLKIYSFLTNKPLIVVANVDDSESSKKYVNQIRSKTDQMGVRFFEMNIKLENELSFLSLEEKKEFLDSIGRKDSAIDQFISLSFKTLNLSTFFTVGEKEVRSWTFKNNSLAPDCAGLIHSDIQRGFIKAKVVKYEDFIEEGNFGSLKKKGKISVEGRNYVVQDGDIILFEFNI